MRVGGSASGEIKTWRNGETDRDWFAVTLEAGKNYQIDLEGVGAGVGTLQDPYLRGVHDAQGNLIPGTTDDNGSLTRDSRLEFKPAAGDTYYVAASAGGYWEGTYTLSVEEVSDGM